MVVRSSVLALALLATAPALAADVGEVRRACGIMPRSPLLSLSSGDMQQQVNDRFSRSIQIANAPQTVTSTSPRFVWATETKAACGIAIGYFGGGEVNEEWVNKCDCFYGRMMAYTNAVR
ncbi:hypothetical protein [Alsobacter sp. R-9]